MATYIDNVVVVPNVDHGYLRVCHAEQTLREPHRVPIKIELLQLVLQLFGERCVVLVMRVLAFSPLSEERSVPHCSIIVDLIASANHHVEWPRLVGVQNIPP